MSHRIDLVLPDGRTIFVPLTDELKGSDIKTFCESSGLSNFVICRNSPNGNSYEVLFTSCPDIVPQSEGIKEDFVTSPLSAFFLPDINVFSKRQRMPIFIFDAEKFAEKYNIITKGPALSAFVRKHVRFTLRVRLPTLLCIDVETKPSKTIASIQKSIHETMTNLYGEENVRYQKAYRLGTMKGEYPSHKVKFCESPEMIAAYKRQEIDHSIPQFVFMQVEEDDEFIKTSLIYTRDLELRPIINSPEVRCFNSSFSELRQKVESERNMRLEEHPLLARMRINAADPPLTTCKKQKIPIKVDIRAVSLSEEATALSMFVDFDTTAEKAIRDLFAKMVEHQGIGKGFEPDNYALVLQGTDEVVAGDFRFDNFVCVRQFLLSVKTLMNFLLVDKNQLIEQIRAKELSYKALEEQTPEKQYRAISLKKNIVPTFQTIPGFPHSLAQDHFMITIIGCFHIPEKLRRTKYAIRAVMLHGSNEISTAAVTKPACGSTSVQWNETLNLGIQIMQIPRSARIALTLYDFESIGTKNSAVATINIPVFNFDGWFNSGISSRSMWNQHDTDPLLTTCQCEEETAARILYRIPSYFYPISFYANNNVSRPSSVRITAATKEAVNKIKKTKYDPLKKLTKEQRADIYRYRNELSEDPEFLPLVLASIDYTIPSQTAQINNILDRWAKPPPTIALSLLDSEFADQRVREYAVKCLDCLSDDEIMLYMLQLVQALKYEMYDDSPICRFLFRRGLKEPKFLGHTLFWQLISEAHVSHIRRRFSSFVVNFLYGIGIYRDELLKGYMFTQELVRLNKRLCKLSHSEATEPFREALRNFELPKEFHLPIDPRLIVDKFIVEKCKVMNSKKKPFWLTFHNAAPFSTEPIRILFKVGDDLRQDQLTLQLMKTMEYLWRNNGLDLHMRCYGVLPTGFNQGFIEVVPNAITEQVLQQEKGTFSGIWDANTIRDYLWKVNQTEQTRQIARQNFMYSSAGYAVATCVLGIADRHPGNIMLQTDGHFLHIDFGHFLGNFKTKLGYQRENAPYHFSPACAAVLNAKDGDADLFKQYQDLCGQGLNILRHNSNLLITLFLLMLGTGIPELQKPEDIKYMTKMLFLDKTDEEAKVEFDRLTTLSLESTRTKLNNLFHNIAVSD